MAEWYYAKGDKEKVGPLTIEQLARAFLNGEINADTYVQKEGMEKWRRFDRLSAFEKLNAMRAEMAQKKLSESFLNDTSPNISTSYIADKKAISTKPAATKTIIKKASGDQDEGQETEDETIKLSTTAQAGAILSYVPYYLREALSRGLSFTRHVIAIAAYGALLLILCAEINNYAKLKIGFLDTVHARVSSVLKGRGSQTTFDSTCDNSAAERRAMALEGLYDKAKIFEDLGEFEEVEMLKQKIAQLEAVTANCAQ